MADQSDENRLAPSDRGPGFGHKLSLEVSGDEAEDSMPREPDRTRDRPSSPRPTPLQTASLPLASRDALTIPDLSNRPVVHRSSPTAAQKAASEGQNAFIAYLGRPVGGHVRMEKSTPTVADITISNLGIEAMNDLWSHRDQWVEPAMRWIHLPGNNPEWVGDAMYHILDKIVRTQAEAWEKDPAFAETTMQEILRPGYWANQLNMGLPNLPHSRFMRPFCRQMSNIPDSPNKLGANEHLVYLMPYLHWETSGNFDAMTEAIRGTPLEPNNLNHKECDTLRAYLHSANPIHVRRSLDQSYYSTLVDTSARDKDQVVQKYARKKLKKQDADCPMIMVNQCWLWILGGNTVLSAFPQQWSTQSDPSTNSADVLGSILQDLSHDTVLARLIDAKSLAYLIIDRCASNIFDPDSISNTDLQFVRFFDESIDELNEQQSQSLRSLWEDVRQTGEGNVADSLFNLKPDFATLEGIKDIMEELSMLSHVAHQQNRALRSLVREEVSPQAAGILDKPSHHSGSDTNRTVEGRLSDNPAVKVQPPMPATSPSILGRHSFGRPKRATPRDEHSDHETSGLKMSPRLLELWQRAEERDSEFKSLVKKATATYKALHDLLDLKQRQANLSEAIQARRSANEMEIQNDKMQVQNNSIMLFTVVTILFLPLSSLASIFGINAMEFGQGHVTLGRIFTYLFPISAFVVGLTFLLAFNQNIRMIILLWLDIIVTWSLLWFPTVSVNHYVKHLEEKLNQMQKNKTVKGEAKYQKPKKEKIARRKKRTQIGQQGSQNPVGDNQAAPTSEGLPAGASPPPPTSVREANTLANAVVPRCGSTRSKVADEEVPRGAAAATLHAATL